MNILYEDAALVVLDKPAGLSSEEGVPAALRQLWSQPDAFVGVVHRLDTGVSGLMVFARTPGAAAALSRQITQSQNAYAVQDAGPKGSRKCRSSSSGIGPSLQRAGRSTARRRHPEIISSVPFSHRDNKYLISLPSIMK